MKILKITIAILLFTITANAQITKGNWMVGGDGNFSSKRAITNDGVSGISTTGVNRSVEISPNIGYFLINQLALGLKIEYQGQFYPGYYNTVAQNSNTISGGVFARYYFLKPKKIVNVFFEGDYFIGNRNNNSWAYESFNTTINSYKIISGVSLFFNESVGIELTLQYGSENRKINQSMQSTIDTNDFQVGLGFQIYLKKEK